jgi:hypothetical protein
MDALLHYKIPKSVREVQSLYGLLGYFRSFVPGFAKVMEPISKLLKEGAELKWTIKHTRAIETEVQYVQENA